MPETHRAGNLPSRATFFVHIASNTPSQELRCHGLPTFEYSVLQSPLLAEELPLSLSKSQQQRSSVSGEKQSRQLEFFAMILSPSLRQAPSARVIPTNDNIAPTFIRTVTHLKSSLPRHSKRQRFQRYFKNHWRSLQKKSVCGCSPS